VSVSSLDPKIEAPASFQANLNLVFEQNLQPPWGKKILWNTKPESTNIHVECNKIRSRPWYGGECKEGVIFFPIHSIINRK
jgi:hypothetical protein